MTKTKNVQVSDLQPTYNVPELLTQLQSKSAVIRYLASQGMNVKTIHKLLIQHSWTNNEGTHPFRYQHVRNVLNTIVKKKSS